MLVSWKPIVAVVIATVLTIPTGCDSSSSSSSQTDAQSTANHSDHEHGHNHEADNLTEGMEQLDGYCQKVKTAFEKDTPEDAHDALHEVGHLLEALPALAEKSGKLATAEIDSVKKQVEVLFDAFGELDETMHGGEAVVYSEIDSKIQTAMNTLRELAK